MDLTADSTDITGRTVADGRQSYRSANEPDPLSEPEIRALMRLANLQFTPRMMTVLLQHFEWNASRIFESLDIEFDDVPGFLPRQLVRLRDPAYDVSDRQWRWLEKAGAFLLTANRPDYPQQLLEIPDAPPLLFVRGSLEPADVSSVGMVGSRNATPYGFGVSERLARELAEHGVTVVSGGAMGIDTAAHRGALDAGGRTIAILGCGIDVDYPRDNRNLFERIAASGAVISEYALGSQPDSFRFPQRNRIISGLSLGTLVVEAPRQSGSLITARYAAEHGRPVMTVPANIDRPNSFGSNDLLKDGATPIMEVGDILLALRLVTVPARKEHQTALNLDKQDDEGEKSESKPAARTMKSLAAITQDLPENQRKLIAALSETPRHIDSLAADAGLSASTVGVEMTMLELAGLVRRLPGNTYILAVG